MKSIDIHKFETDLDDLLDRAQGGEVFVICIDGKPYAQLRPLAPPVDEEPLTSTEEDKLAAQAVCECGHVVLDHDHFFGTPGKCTAWSCARGRRCAKFCAAKKEP